MINLIFTKSYIFLDFFLWRFSKSYIILPFIDTFYILFIPLIFTLLLLCLYFWLSQILRIIFLFIIVGSIYISFLYMSFWSIKRLSRQSIAWFYSIKYFFIRFTWADFTHFLSINILFWWFINSVLLMMAYSSFFKRFINIIIIIWRHFICISYNFMILWFIRYKLMRSIDILMSWIWI